MQNGTQQNGSKLLILVVDDDVRVTDMLRRGLAYNGYEVAVAHGGEEGMKQVWEQKPDLVVLDIMMPDVDGLEVCQRLRLAGNRVPVMMLTARDAVVDKVIGLETGADDYLVKPFAFEELIARIRVLLRRGEPAIKQALSYGDLSLDTAARIACRGQRQIELSTTEYKLLHLFLQNPGQVLTRGIIMDRVWSYDFGGDSNVLEVYIRYLRNKLEANGESRLIQTVRGAGYALRE